MNTLQKLLIAAIAVLPLASCKNSDVWDPNSQQNETKQETEVNTFDYNTTSSVKTSISYTSFPNDVKGSVYFEVYDEYPYESTDAFANLKSDIEPVFTGYTSADGTFSEDITLPAYMTKAYVYSPNPLVTTLMTADVVDGAFTATDAEATTKASTRSAEGTRAGSNGYSKAITEDGWKTLLIGDNYDKTTGKLNSNVIYNSGNLKLTDANYKYILSAFNACRESVNTSTDVGNIPYSYGREKDMVFSKDAELAITLVQSATWWTSTLGYYYYDEGEAPTSYNELKNRAIVIAPNTMSKNTSGSQNYNGMDENTTVQLKYFGKYENGKYANETGTTTFPAGTHIGFVLYSNGWTNRAHPTNGEYGGSWDANGNMPTRAATSMDCCVYASSADQGKPLTAVFGIGDFVVVSFEDDKLANEGRYTDCVFTTKSNPIDALDVTKVEETVNTNNEKIGVYAFEDQWPSKGDYDMNDIVIDLSRTKSNKLNLTTDKWGTVTASYVYVSESFDVTTHHNYATLDNHWAIRIENIATQLTTDKIKVTKDGEDIQASITKDGNDYIVQMESVDVSTDHEYSISLMWEKTFKNQGEFNLAYNKSTDVQVFANRPSENWEVHIPYEAPTSTIDMTLFGTQDDMTNVSTGNWYTRAGEYPFAFFLSGATHNDISPLLDRQNESTPIDQLYSKFASWVESNGNNNKDWYKAE